MTFDYRATSYKGPASGFDFQTDIDVIGKAQSPVAMNSNGPFHSSTETGPGKLNTAITLIGDPFPADLDMLLTSAYMSTAKVEHTCSGYELTLQGLQDWAIPGPTFIRGAMEALKIEVVDFGGHSPVSLSGIMTNCFDWVSKSFAAHSLLIEMSGMHHNMGIILGFPELYVSHEPRTGSAPLSYSYPD